MQRKKQRRGRVLITAILLATALLLGPPLLHLGRAAWQDQHTLPTTAAGFADDVSGLNRTAVRVTVALAATPDAAERQLADLLAHARAERLPVTMAGARHSMGGHSIAADGIVIDTRPFRQMSLHEDGRILRVGAGAMWSEIIPFLDRHGRAVAIMQSDHNFSVGGSLSVNVHGWQARRPPIAASVRAFRLMLADGRVLRCSREENPRLFAAALGGYGLFGIILDAELWTVPNAAYMPLRVALPAATFAATLEEQLARHPDAELAYGRLRVTRANFLEDAVLTLYRRAPDAVEVPPRHAARMTRLRRAIFRGQVDSDYGKFLRWWLERTLGDHVDAGAVSRNQLLDEDVALYANRDGSRTDILHEYFLPGERLADFLAACREIIPRHGGELLNVTLRDVRADPDTLLRYADRDLVAVVMFFDQRRDAEAERRMAAMTRELIDASLDLEGRYYLPYRPHATAAQFLRAYPMAHELLRLKHEVDPDTLFRNAFYERYLQPLDAAATSRRPAQPSASAGRQLGGGR
jgi:FAD/FMN-containing dehydrogenase